jgi:2-phosphoglycerate kinase
MAAQDEGRRKSGGGRGSGRIWIEEAGRRRPFMRGIMIHSLMARGVDFEDAFRTAGAIRERLRGRQVVPKREVAEAVRELLGDEPFQEENRRPRSVDISVTGSGGGLPFSKGILSQSLLAAAIDPHEAFEVAREIERDLLERGVRAIERRELRQLSYEVLARRAGPQTAERYLVWRRYQDPDRPVIILLGGATGVGKTSLGLEVAHRLGIGRVLSTDSIRQIMRIMLSRDLVPALHASSFDAHRTLPPELLGEDPVIEGYRSQAASVSVGVRATIDRAVAENVSLVLDGVSIAPGLIDLEAYADLAHIFFLVVATLDEEAFNNRFVSRAVGAQRRPPRRYLENLEAILRIQDHILDLADRHDVPIVDNVSFDRSVLFIIRHVTEALRKREDLDDEA